jgi:hypothetical protein
MQDLRTRQTQLALEARDVWQQRTQAWCGGPTPSSLVPSGSVSRQQRNTHHDSPREARA